MRNILEEQERIRGYSDEMLKDGLSKTPMQAPFTQYLAASELGRRKQMRDAALKAMNGNKESSQTVIDRLIGNAESAGPPKQFSPQSNPQMPQAPQMAQMAQAPQGGGIASGYGHGGVVQGYEHGGYYHPTPAPQAGLSGTMSAADIARAAKEKQDRLLYHQYLMSRGDAGAGVQPGEGLNIPFPLGHTDEGRGRVQSDYSPEVPALRSPYEVIRDGGRILKDLPRLASPDPVAGSAANFDGSGRNATGADVQSRFDGSGRSDPGSGTGVGGGWYSRPGFDGSGMNAPGMSPRSRFDGSGRGEYPVIPNAAAATQDPQASPPDPDAALWAEAQEKLRMKAESDAQNQRDIDALNMATAPGEKELAADPREEKTNRLTKALALARAGAYVASTPNLAEGITGGLSQYVETMSGQNDKMSDLANRREDAQTAIDARASEGLLDRNAANTRSADSLAQAKLLTQERYGNEDQAIKARYITDIYEGLAEDPAFTEDPDVVAAEARKDTAEVTRLRIKRANDTYEALVRSGRIPAPNGTQPPLVEPVTVRKLN